jgi:hypothetical protein
LDFMRSLRTGWTPRRVEWASRVAYCDIRFPRSP